MGTFSATSAADVCPYGTQSGDLCCDVSTHIGITFSITGQMQLKWSKRSLRVYLGSLVTMHSVLTDRTSHPKQSFKIPDNCPLRNHVHIVFFVLHLYHQCKRPFHQGDLEYDSVRLNVWNVDQSRICTCNFGFSQA